MKQLIKFIFLAMVCMALFGCAHPINMKPDIGAIKGEATTTIEKEVGYHISEANMAVEVTTPGGGGDKVRYFPYRDMDAGFYKALSEVFKGVRKIMNPKDVAAIAKSGITLLIVPEITTTSSSPSPFTWPPTKFTVTLNCSVVDAKGQNITNIM